MSSETSIPRSLYCIGENSDIWTFNLYEGILNAPLYVAIHRVKKQLFCLVDSFSLKIPNFISLSGFYLDLM
jgi:hypothetical protein